MHISNCSRTEKVRHTQKIREHIKSHISPQSGHCKVVGFHAGTICRDDLETAAVAFILNIANRDHVDDQTRLKKNKKESLTRTKVV
jgi:hypothetical protein